MISILSHKMQQWRRLHQDLLNAIMLMKHKHKIIDYNTLHDLVPFLPPWPHPLPLLFPLRLFHPHWPSFLFSSLPSSLLPQDLCTCHSLLLEHFEWLTPHDPSLSSVFPPQKAFSNHLVYSSLLTSHCYSPSCNGMNRDTPSPQKIMSKS